MWNPEEILSVAADSIFGEGSQPEAVLRPMTLAEREFIRWIANRKSKETAGTGRQPGDPRSQTEGEIA